ncbi:MAG: S8 family serine peptidase [candidate division WOR-3 bacterium]
MKIFFLFPLYLFAFPFYREPIKSSLPEIPNNLVWVFFTDKGFRTEREYEKILENFSCDLPIEVLEKRLQRMGEPYNFFDLPVFEGYINEIVARGGRLRNISNWLNAASFEIDKSILPEIYSLPFVYDIKPVAMKTFSIQEGERVLGDDSVIYGMSYQQIAMLGINKAHEKGIYGSNVKIGILDTGLKRKRSGPEDTTVHSAVENLKVFKEHDFLAGSDFYFAKRSRDFLPETTRIKNFKQIEDPEIGYLFLSTGDTLPILLFIADTLYLNYPKRALFYSFFNGYSWSLPGMIDLPNVVLHDLSLTYGNYLRTFFTLQGADYDERRNLNIFFGYFENGALKPVRSVENGRKPFILSNGEKVFLFFTNPDSVIKIKVGENLADSVIWQDARLVGIIPEKVKEFTGVANGSNIHLFALGLKTGKVYYFHSEDNGNTFTERTSPFSENCSQIRGYALGETILLFAKRYSPIPLQSLLFKKYLLGNWEEEKIILENLSWLGDFSFYYSDTLYLLLEREGKIEFCKSSNWEDWSVLPIDTSGFLYSPNILNYKGDILISYQKKGDDDTDHEPGEDYAEQPHHGTRMASLIAGYSRGNLIGVAPGCQLIVAKTEKLATKTGINYEFLIEEDNWVKGLEWAEANGADIISSSLGYRGWYTDSDFDGKTAVTSIAAGIAAKRGLVIVTAMGNRGRDSLTHPWPKTYLVAPGDAEGVLTIGGIKRDSTPWSGSGTGPTVDGRIKPDLVALSVDAIVACPYADGYYEYSTGTSAATALVAGLCALALEAHPNWNVDSLRPALFSTASRTIPDSIFGYGIPNIDSLLKVYPSTLPSYEKDEIGDIYPQPFILGKQEKVYFPILLRNLSYFVNIRIYDLRGKLVMEKEIRKKIPPGRYTGKEELENYGLFWDGKDKKGNFCASGLYLILLRTGFGRSVKKFVLLR